MTRNNTGRAPGPGGRQSGGVAFFAGLVGSLCLVLSAHAEQDAQQPAAQLSLEQLLSFSDALHIVREHYVDEVGDQQLLDAALVGMLTSLDPYSAVLEPAQLEQQSDSNQGRKAGIGMNVTVRDQRLYAHQVVEGGPASLAGIRPGDLVIAIDGKPVRGRPLQEAIDALDGPPDTSMTISVRSGKAPARGLEVVRAYTAVASVQARLLDGRVAYLGLERFHQQSPRELQAGLERLRAEAGDEALRGIVLDLRNNLGGTVTAAMQIADGFLDQGLVVHTQGRSPSSDLAYRAQPGQWAPDLPLVLLINRHSASAAEILAGALHDHGRARLFGETSFGKGSVQSILPLRDGRAVKLTTGRYLTPSGHTIDGQGIEPDVPITDKRQAPWAPRKDNVLSAALEYLLAQQA